MEVLSTESLAALAGVLNVWHLAHYTRFQHSIMESVRADFAHGDLMGAAAAVEHRCAEEMALQHVNTAIDVMLLLLHKM